jgi:hypothetical protein
MVVAKVDEDDGTNVLMDNTTMIAFGGTIRWGCRNCPTYGNCDTTTS